MLSSPRTSPRKYVPITARQAGRMRRMYFGSHASTSFPLSVRRRWTQSSTAISPQATAAAAPFAAASSAEPISEGILLRWCPTRSVQKPRDVSFKGRRMCRFPHTGSRKPVITTLGMREQLPPGPRAPRAVQTLGWWTRPHAFLERCRARYGKRFTIRLLGTPPFVMLSEPDELKQLFTAAPDVLHPGEGARILEQVVGTNSVILLDEDAHLEQRKLMLPAFHGEKMQRLTRLMQEVTEREVAGWPTATATSFHRRLQALTLEIILRAVFGLDVGARLDAMRERLTEILDIGARPLAMLPQFQRDFPWSREWSRFLRLREETDELIFDLVAERRRDPADRDDVLAMLLDARHDDGTEMSPEELRDELMTLLVAGHETTASELAWAFERLPREPRGLQRLTAEIDGGGDDAYPTAATQEAARPR